MKRAEAVLNGAIRHGNGEESCLGMGVNLAVTLHEGPLWGEPTFWCMKQVRRQ
ncbi:MAG: hypothetical protein JWN04_2797 [Myxococcaceae bacterium]|nr:hypothetical protein [Myxococcaceae bacterium]